MRTKPFGTSDEALSNYALRTFRPEDAVLAEIRERAAREGLPPIAVGAMDGLHLELLARAAGARRIVEIGTLAGYSGVCLARALPADGRLWTFEYEARHARVAEESFTRAGVRERTEVLVGSAIERLPEIERHGPFDLVFVDADKVSYPHYLDWAARNLRRGGLVIGDNTFAWGLVGADKFEDEDDRATATAIREFNRRIAESGEFRGTILPTSEGLTVAVRL